MKKHKLPLFGTLAAMLLVAGTTRGQEEPEIVLTSGLRTRESFRMTDHVPPPASVTIAPTNRAEIWADRALSAIRKQYCFMFLH